MKKNLVVWRPTIIFDPNEVGWQRVSDIERAFAAFFDEHNMDANLISVIGSPNESVWVLSQKDKLDEMASKADQHKSNKK